MFNNAAMDRTRQLFADQFTRDGDGFLYRKSLKGPAIRVSSEQRDTFIADFVRDFRRLVWFSVAIVMALILAAAFVSLDSANQDSGMVWVYIGSALLLVPYVLAWRWMWNRPTAMLDRCTPVAEALSRNAARRAALERITWSNLGLAVLGVGFLLSKVVGDDKPSILLVGWHRLWLVGAAMALVGIAFQAFRKWRLQHD